MIARKNSKRQAFTMTAGNAIRLEACLFRCKQAHDLISELHSGDLPLNFPLTLIEKAMEDLRYLTAEYPIEGEI